jgi:Ran GTPase-activating protein (RanGAP) involved in mRNA processing and transport
MFIAALRADQCVNVFMTESISLLFSAGGEIHSEDNIRVDYLLQLFLRLRSLGLTMIKITGQGLSSANLSVLASLLPSNLQHLDLSFLGLTTASVHVLAKRLPRTRIQIFNISHNPIGDGSTWMLLEFIRQDIELKSLDISYCDLTSGGIWPICNALSQREFDLLDVSGNVIRAEGAVHVKQLLDSSPHLRAIRIDNVQLGEGDVEMLVEAARQCQFTELVSIVGNDPISYQGLPEFIKVDMLAKMH